VEEKKNMVKTPYGGEVLGDVGPDLLRTRNGGGFVQIRHIWRERKVKKGGVDLKKKTSTGGGRSPYRNGRITRNVPLEAVY